MKRLKTTIASVLLLGVTACSPAAMTYANERTQTSHYYSTGPDNSDAGLQRAGRICDLYYGAVQIGSDTPEPYKQCMLNQGWEYGYTNQKGYYPDPRHPGLVCHDFTVFGVVGSSCSNF